MNSIESLHKSLDIGKASGKQKRGTIAPINRVEEWLLESAQDAPISCQTQRRNHLLAAATTRAADRVENRVIPLSLG